MLKIVPKLLLFIFLLVHAGLQAIIFRSQGSSLELSSNATYSQCRTTANRMTGTVKRSFSSSFTGRPIYFYNGIYSENGAELIMTGTYDNTQTYSIRLTGNASAQALSNDTFYSRVYVSGSGNTLEGYPEFTTPSAIQLANSSATLTSNIYGDLTTNLELNGGALVLGNNLNLGEGVVITSATAPGQITLGGNNLFVGAQSTTWTSTLLWTNAQSISFGGDVRMPSRWYFKGAGVIFGNNNVLDLSATGKIWIRRGGSLELNNLTVVGWGSGQFIFEDHTSTLSLFGVTLVMDSNVTLTRGRVYVNGPVKVITQDKLLAVNDLSKLTIVRDTVHYDTLDYNDQNNISFADAAVNASYVQGGSIRKITSLKLGNFDIAGDTYRDLFRTAEAVRTLDREFVVSPLRKLVFSSDVTVSGAGFHYQFARKPSVNILSIAAGVKAKFTNITLDNFPTDYTTYGANSTITFGDLTQVNIRDSATITTTWYFEGTTILDGGNKILDFATNGNFVLRPGSSLFIDNVTLRDIHSYKIRCMDNRCTLSIGNVIWKQDGNFTLTNGRFDVVGLWDLKGSSTFQYSTNNTSTITSFGTMIIEDNMTFKYAPTVARKDLLRFSDVNARLWLNGGSLATTTTGMRLTVGTLYVTSQSYLKNQSAVSTSQGIFFGDLNTVNDLTLTIENGQQLTHESGRLIMQQA